MTEANIPLDNIITACPKHKSNRGPYTQNFFTREAVIPIC